MRGRVGVRGTFVFLPFLCDLQYDIDTNRHDEIILVISDAEVVFVHDDKVDDIETHACSERSTPYTHVRILAQNSYESC